MRASTGAKRDLDVAPAAGAAVLILACLGPALLRHVRGLAVGDHEVLAVESWSELVRVAHASAPDLAIVDPSMDMAGNAGAVDAVERLGATMPIVVYGTLTPRTARFVSAVDTVKLRHLVFHGIDDSPAQFRRLLDGYGGPAADEALLSSILATLTASGAPPTLVNAVRTLFRAPRQFRGAEDLAAAAGLSRRWVNACLAAARLAPARILVTVARVSRAYRELSLPGMSVQQVACRLRYPDVKSLRRHARDCTQLTPSEWRRRLPADQCIARLAMRVGVHTTRPVALVRSHR